MIVESHLDSIVGYSQSSQKQLGSESEKMSNDDPSLVEPTLTVDQRPTIEPAPNQTN